ITIARLVRLAPFTRVPPIKAASTGSRLSGGCSGDRADVMVRAQTRTACRAVVYPWPKHTDNGRGRMATSTIDAATLAFRSQEHHPLMRACACCMVQLHYNVGSDTAGGDLGASGALPRD